MLRFHRSLLLLAGWLIAAVAGVAQRLTGTVCDAETGEVLPYVNISHGGGRVAQTSDEGVFSVPYEKGAYKFSYVGYKAQTLHVTSRPVRLVVRLQPLENRLGESVVTGRRKRYRRKDNPAVELMRRVIAAKPSDKLMGHDYCAVTKYSKITFALNDVSERLFNDRRYRKLAFLKDHIEVNNETGKLVLPINVNETVSRELHRRSPKADKSIITGKQTSGINDLFQTGDVVNTVLEDCFTDVNIYDDDIRLLQFQFTSPVSARSAISFYRYFIVDTLQLDGVRAIHVSFTPNNPQDIGFSGSIFVADSTWRVVKVDMGIPVSSDVNFVERMRVIQDFTTLPTGEQVLKRDDVLVEIKLLDFVQRFMVKRLTDYSDYSFAPIADDSLRFLGDQRTLAEARSRDEAFWEAHRPQPLTANEDGMAGLVSEVGSMRGFKPLLWVARAFIENYVETTTDPKKGSKVDIGPINTIFSHNYHNGFRLRGSATTTANFHKHLFLKGYLAYGFRDRRVMGSGEATWSFVPKAYMTREFPVHNLTLNYTNDIMSPSDKFLPTDKDNVFVAFKWAKVNHMMYFDRWTLTYDREWENNLRFTARLRRETDTPTDALSYQPLDGAGTPTAGAGLHRLATADVMAGLTYSPGAKWFTSKQRRFSPNHDFPTFALSHTLGVRAFGGRYAYNLTEASVRKRFLLNSWGRIDAKADFGVQWNRVPFPLLCMPAANLSYVLQDNTFVLINNMEFPTDRFASLKATWELNGKLFNRLPLLRRLKWREFLGFNMLWGTLTDKNNPLLPHNAADNRLFYFPGNFTTAGYSSLSRVMEGSRPYVEVRAGVYNIFKIVHLEYVRRLSYTDGVPMKHRWGIRGKLDFTF